MKKAADKFVRIFAAVLAVLSVSILLFTLVSTLFLNRTDKEWFGYKAFIVLSDSMSATDFSAGDLVFVRHVDPSTLQPGDIIAFTSRNDSNYGDTVTHKIRALTTTADGTPGFTTYGTTTDTDDEAVVPYSDVIGRYAGHLPKVGLFFNFLKTTPGYLLCIFLPFALLILSQAVQTVRLFRAYRREQAGAGDSDAFALPEPQSGAEIAARLAAGEDVTLQADTAFTDADGHCIDCVIAPGKAAALHLNGHRLKGTIQLADGAALTVHGKGMIQATARSHSRAGCPIYARGQGCRVDLYGGRYLGGVGSCAVCAAAGQVILHGGLYAVKGDSADHLLYSVGDGAITVEGGRFVGFDPAACLAPGRTTAAQETDKGILYVVKEL
ncbi:signal peptidase I [Gemmiger sp.]|uniref:signal peptidase I n=1 Tax=Gemmiger sp. TaxID=2049027 RepID=UPI003AB658EE